MFTKRVPKFSIECASVVRKEGEGWLVLEFWKGPGEVYVFVNEIDGEGCSDGTGLREWSRRSPGWLARGTNRREADAGEHTRGRGHFTELGVGSGWNFLRLSLRLFDLRRLDW